MYPLSDRVSFVDEILKRGIRPVGCGLENETPYLLFKYDSIIPFMTEWYTALENAREIST